MPNSTAFQRLLQSEPSVVATLDAVKAKRFRAKTMLIPSPLDIDAAVRRIPTGTLLSLSRLRELMALDAGADVTCPYAARVGWLLVAEAAEEQRTSGESNVAPWWRVTRDGIAEPKAPGGSERHRMLLAAEGVELLK